MRDAAEAGQHRGGVAVVEVVRVDVLRDDGAGEVEHPAAEVVDVHLEPQPHEGARRGGERDGGPPGALRGGRRQLGHDAGGDEPVDERRDGGAREAARAGDVGP